VVVIIIIVVVVVVVVAVVVYVPTVILFQNINKQDCYQEYFLLPAKEVRI